MFHYRSKNRKKNLRMFQNSLGLYEFIRIKYFQLRNAQNKIFSLRDIKLQRVERRDKKSRVVNAFSRNQTAKSHSTHYFSND